MAERAFRLYVPEVSGNFIGCQFSFGHHKIDQYGRVPGMILRRNEDWTVLAFAAIFATGVAGAGRALGAESVLTQQCSDGTRGDGKITDDPEKCGHGRMLRQGGNVFAIYELYAKRKLK